MFHLHHSAAKKQLNRQVELDEWLTAHTHEGLKEEAPRRGAIFMESRRLTLLRHHLIAATFRHRHSFGRIGATLSENQLPPYCNRLRFVTTDIGCDCTPVMKFCLRNTWDALLGDLGKAAGFE